MSARAIIHPFSNISCRSNVMLHTYSFARFSNLQNYAKKKNFNTSNKIYTGSLEQIVQKRQNQAKWIAIEEEKKKDLDIFIEAYSDTVIDFKLYGDHYDYKTQKIDAILNFYQISYIRMFNPLYHMRIRTQFEDTIKGLPFPLFRVNVSLEPAFFLGIDKAEQWLIDHDFIILPKHRTHSAWASQGIEFAENRLNEALDRLFWAPTLYWKSHAKSYTEQSKKALALTVAKIQLIQIAKNVYSNIKLMRKETEAYKNARNDVLALIEEWKGRLEDNDYHGGINPDEADFAMYGVIMAKYNSKSFQRFIEINWPAPVRRWFVRMQQGCQYESRQLYN